MTPYCEIRRTLAEQFATTARLYAEIAVNLACSGTFGTDYDGLCGKTIEARERSDAAFRALTEHVALHQCGTTAQSEQHIRYVVRQKESPLA